MYAEIKFIILHTILLSMVPRDNILPFTNNEFELIKHVSILEQIDISPYDVMRYIQKNPENVVPPLSILESFMEFSIEEKVAQMISMSRLLDHSEQMLAQNTIVLSNISILIGAGVKLLKSEGTYWFFEPTVEKIFELDRADSKRIYNYISEFQMSNHLYILHQMYNSLNKKLFEYRYNYLNIHSDSLDDWLNIYQICMRISEKAFPNLLALKIILDGHTPSIEPLQRKRASAVRSELLDQENSNSVYFDLIVSQVDTSLRNGIAHGDIVHDPTLEKINIQSSGREYSYDQLREIIKRNVSIAAFLSGLYEGLVIWQYWMHLNDSISRDDLNI
jgi:hypothetical protein